MPRCNCPDCLEAAVTRSGVDFPGVPTPCPKCDGTGECPDCDESAICRSCFGSESCRVCMGLGLIYS